MADVVITCPKSFWSQWIAEGDAAGEPPTGEEWIFFLNALPDINPGERVYVVAHGKLRGYAPLIRVKEHSRDQQGGLIRGSGAVAMTLDEPIKGFQGFRYRWWDRSLERPFPDWKKP
jgi:hypothetical protein